MKDPFIGRTGIGNNSNAIAIELLRTLRTGDIYLMQEDIELIRDIKKINEVRAMFLGNWDKLIDEPNDYKIDKPSGNTD